MSTEGMLNAAMNSPTSTASPPLARTTSGRIGWMMNWCAKPNPAAMHAVRSALV
jgi:hypothetical protein